MKNRIYIIGLVVISLLLSPSINFASNPDNDKSEAERKEAKAKFEKLSDEIRDAFYSEDYATELISIMKVYYPDLVTKYHNADNVKIVLKNERVRISIYYKRIVINPKKGDKLVYVR
ncbi:MAG: hypothetical protein KKA07_12420 [Bacteroidetes bacterium]|nr:hypothetical protein [Bacteroidota bacterium]MBU1719863.1 hypothetical protein [Bacteroidota bacterium]